MPRTLILLRHAKAEASRGDDFERGLTVRGEADATQAGVFLADHGLAPTLALVSDARRTVRTAEIVREHVAFDWLRDHELYNAEAPRMGRRIARVDSAIETLMVVAHNPGLMELAIELAYDGDRAEIERLRGRLPPCGLAVLTFAAEGWRDALGSGGRLDALVYPEDLAQEG